MTLFDTIRIESEGTVNSQNVNSQNWQVFYTSELRALSATCLVALAQRRQKVWIVSAQRIFERVRKRYRTFRQRHQRYLWSGISGRLGAQDFKQE